MSISVKCHLFQWLRSIGPPVSGEGGVSGVRVNIGHHKTCHLMHRMQETPKYSELGTSHPSLGEAENCFRDDVNPARPRTFTLCWKYSCYSVLGRSVVGIYVICKTQILRLPPQWWYCKANIDLDNRFLTESPTIEDERCSSYVQTFS